MFFAETKLFAELPKTLKELLSRTDSEGNTTVVQNLALRVGDVAVE
jgi:hypothetical protein